LIVHRAAKTASTKPSTPPADAALPAAPPVKVESGALGLAVVRVELVVDPAEFVTLGPEAAATAVELERYVLVVTA